MFKILTLSLTVTLVAFCINYIHAQTTQRFEHHGNHKEFKSKCYKRLCPQLFPNYNNEHNMTFEQFKQQSFFACDHEWNKAHSTPGDFNMRGNYSSPGLLCSPLKKEQRDQTNYDGLVVAGKECEKEAKDKCGDAFNVKTT